MASIGYFFTSIMGGYLHTKFEARGQKKPPFFMEHLS